MKNINLYYFSGTGNTKFIAEQLCDEFSLHQTTCQLYAMEEFTLGKQKLELTDTCTVGIGFPVHAMNAPKIVYEFLALLPLGRFSYFIFKTAGDPLWRGGSNLPIKRVLGQKGWRCKHESLFVMPANMASKCNPNKIKHLCLLAEKQAAKIVTEIVADKVVRDPDSMLLPFFQAFSRGENRGARINSNRWVVSENCTKCGKCAKDCPTNNITREDGKLIFSTSCIWCLRCSFFCPVQALSLPAIIDKFRVPPFDLRQIVDNPDVKGDFFLTDKSVKHILYRRFFRKQGIL